MDMFVGVAVFFVACIATLFGYLYVVKRREAKIAEEEKQKAWKREQNRQRRANKKAMQKVQENAVRDQENMQQMSDPLLQQRGNIGIQAGLQGAFNPLENVLGQGRSDWTQQ